MSSCISLSVKRSLMHHANVRVNIKSKEEDQEPGSGLPQGQEYKPFINSNSGSMIDQENDLLSSAHKRAKPTKQGLTRKPSKLGRKLPKMKSQNSLLGQNKKTRNLDINKV